MNLQNGVRNEFGKCDLPLNTIDRIRTGLRGLGLEATYAPVQVSDLHSLGADMD